MIKNNFENVRLSKIKVNVSDDSFWIAPDVFRIFTPKRKDFIVKKSNSIDEIFQYNQMQVGNYYISFNRDPKFKYFNQLQKLSILKDLEINNHVEKEIEKNGSWFYQYNDFIKIKFDEKSLYKIYRGNSFLINENYFENYVEILKNKGFKKEQWIFYWTGSKFELV